MKTAYRIPDNACACTAAGENAAATVSINRIDVRSFITSIADGAIVRAQTDVMVKGIAFDGGYGVRTVLFSSNGGKDWTEATLGPDLGRYSFRLDAGEHILKVCAINSIGQSQPMTPLWHPQGYMRNAVETVRVISQ